MWTATAPQKPLVFLAKMNIFGDERKKGAFGACIVVLRAVPQRDQTLELLYKLQTQAFGKCGDFWERLQMHVYKHQMRVGFLFWLENVQFWRSAFGAYIRASTGRAGTARVLIN